jgi:hypothetical protein
LADVAWGFGCGLSGRSWTGATLAFCVTPGAGFGLREKSGMLRSPLRFTRASGGGNTDDGM